MNEGSLSPFCWDCHVILLALQRTCCDTAAGRRCAADAAVVAKLALLRTRLGVMKMQEASAAARAAGTLLCCAEEMSRDLSRKGEVLRISFFLYYTLPTSQVIITSLALLLPSREDVSIYTCVGVWTCLHACSCACHFFSPPPPKDRNNCSVSGDACRCQWR